jgi:hypothetical protein
MINNTEERGKLQHHTNETLMREVFTIMEGMPDFERAKEILDYMNPESYHVEKLTDCDFDVMAIPNFGGSEGIYVDCYIEGVYNETGKNGRLKAATLKTLETSLEGMKTMGELCGIIEYVSRDYVNKNYRLFQPNIEAENERSAETEKAQEKISPGSETAVDHWKKLIGERRPEIEDAIWKASSLAQEGLPGTYSAAVRVGGKTLTVYSVTRSEDERDVRDAKFEMSSSKAGKIIDDWTEKYLETVGREAEQPKEKNRSGEMYLEAQKEKSEAQRASEIMSGAAAIPRGLDSNLPNADLDATQEAVMSSIDKANTEIKGLRNSAAETEASASKNAGAKAVTIAKEKLGQGAIVTNAQPGRTYSGKIIGVTGNHPDTIAIQRISGNQAVLHRIKDIAAESNISVGAELSITKGRDGKTMVWTQAETAREKEAQKGMGEERVL